VTLEKFGSRNELVIAVELNGVVSLETRAKGHNGLHGQTGREDRNGRPSVSGFRDRPIRPLSHLYRAPSRSAFNLPEASPDGRLFAYASWESGKEELYVQTLSGPSGKWRISTDGGRELYYIGPARQVHAVKVEPGPTPKFSLPQNLFDALDMITETNTRNRYVVTRGGQRFLLVARQGVARLGATTVVLDWPHARGKN
jgi:hypothetical protein